MTPNKEKLESLINTINSNPFIVIKVLYKDEGHKITLNEDKEDCSLTLDVGHVLLKECSEGPNGAKIPVSDITYKRIYDNFVAVLFQDHLSKREQDYFNLKKEIKMENKFKGQALNMIVVVEEIFHENKTASGLDLSELVDANEKQKRGRVVSVGQGTPRNDDGSYVLKEGSEVIFDKYKVTNFTQDGTPYILVYYPDIVLVF